MSIYSDISQPLDRNGSPVSVSRWMQRRTLLAGERIELPAGAAVVTVKCTGGLAHLRTGSDEVEAGDGDDEADITLLDGDTEDMVIPAGHTHLASADAGEGTVYVSARR